MVAKSDVCLSDLDLKLLQHPAKPNEVEIVARVMLKKRGAVKLIDNDKFCDGLKVAVAESLTFIEPEKREGANG